MTLITESSPSSSTSLTSSPPAEKSTRPRHHRQHHSREFARSDGSLIPLVHPPAPGGMCMSTSNVPVARPTSSLASTPPRPRRLGYDEDGKKLCANVTGFEFKLTTETPRVVHNAGRAYEVMKKDDFRHIRDICRSMDGWTEKFKDHDITVWTHPPDPSTGTKLNMIKLLIEYPDVDPTTLYNCLHDPDYRKVWDQNMVKGYNICVLDAHNDIGYYGAKLPTPLANRDFCNMRSWIELGPKQGFIIRNHSVPHPQCPEQKGYVRGRSICAGYYMFPREGGGTRMYWLAQSDPGGFLPHWAVNIATMKTIPAMMRKLGETVRAYPQWLQKNRPGFVAPWRTPAEPWSDEEDDVVDGDRTRRHPVLLPTAGGPTRASDATVVTPASAGLASSFFSAVDDDYFRDECDSSDDGNIINNNNNPTSSSTSWSSWSTSSTSTTSPSAASSSESQSTPPSLFPRIVNLLQLSSSSSRGSNNNNNNNNDPFLIESNHDIKQNKTPRTMPHPVISTTTNKTKTKNKKKAKELTKSPLTSNDNGSDDGNDGIDDDDDGCGSLPLTAPSSTMTPEEREAKRKKNRSTHHIEHRHHHVHVHSKQQQQEATTTTTTTMLCQVGPGKDPQQQTQKQKQQRPQVVFYTLRSVGQYQSGGGGGGAK
eukprot:PhM_4_TR18442/c5_g1_i2/m.72874